MRLEIFEDAKSIGLEKRCLASFESVEQLTPGILKIALSIHDRGGVHGAWYRLPKGGGERGQLESPALALLEDAEAGQGAKHAVEGRRLDLYGSGQLFDRARTPCEVVRQFKLCGDIDQ